jgi:transposase
MEIKTIGIDIGKTWFHLVGFNRAEASVMRRKFSRGKLLEFLVNLPSALIGMEACPGSQHLARVLHSYGHDVRLIAPKFIKPYLKGQKNDFNDAAAIAEAVARPSMRFVSPRSVEQLDLQAIHRVRSRLVTERTAIMNQIRAFLIEYGLPVGRGPSALRNNLAAILEDATNHLSGAMRQLIARQREHWQWIEDQIDRCRVDIEAVAQRNNDCHRLTSVPGIGVLTATAILAAVGNASNFRKGRELAAWLGLVPKQHSTGGKAKLLGISKQGNGYLRRLLVHGARSLVQHLRRDEHELGRWITQLEQRAHRNVVIVAVANKMARIAWAVLSKQETYRPSVQTA